MKQRKEIKSSTEVFLSLFSKTYILNLYSLRILLSSIFVKVIFSFVAFCLFSCFLLFTPHVYSANLNALYLASCKREIGLILNVNAFEIEFLTLSGNVLNIPRYEVIYLSYYPLNVVPIRDRVVIKSPFLIFKTNINHKIVDLVKGWPIDFTDEKISILTLEGHEVVIDRKSIWEIVKIKNKNKFHFDFNEPSGYEFIHPYTFRNCPLNDGVKKLKASRSVNKTYPQQVLSDPIVIKKEMDRLQIGHEKIKKYQSEQMFYPVPLIYKTENSLGTWYNFGGRHGTTSNRPNNFLPFLSNQSGSEPFSYQHIFKTGVGPLEYSVHEEPQNQFFYGFKASYFHMNMFADPNIALVGKNYNRKKSDFTENDFLMNEALMLELGLDFGYWSFMFFLSGLTHGSLFYNDDLIQLGISLPRVGLSYHNHLFDLDLIFGFSQLNSADDDLTYEEVEQGKRKFDFSTFRANLKLFLWDKWDVQYSLLYSKLHYEGDYFAETKSITNVAYLYYHWSKRYDIGGYVSLESVDRSFGLTSLSESNNKLYPKFGSFISLSF